MSVLVVDASVALKWLVPEVDHAAALRVLESGRDLVAPDLISVEVANAIWKKVQRQELTAKHAREMIADFSTLAVETIALRRLVDDALDVALAIGRTVYDSAYVALAMRLETQVVTADRRLANALAAYPVLSPFICAIDVFAG